MESETPSNCHNFAQLPVDSYLGIFGRLTPRELLRCTEVLIGTTCTGVWESSGVALSATPEPSSLSQAIVSMRLCSQVNIEWCSFARDDAVWAGVLRTSVPKGYAPIAGVPWWRHFTSELESCLAEYPAHERYPFMEQIGSFWKVMHIVEL